MRIDEYGEVRLIERFSTGFTEGLGPNVIGIGDDCSVTDFDEQYFQIATTDLLIEDIHFLRDKITSFDLGRKAMSVNLSDIAAMGGTANNSYLSLGLPRDIEVSYIDGFFEGLKYACDQYNLNLLGGDTTRSPDKIVINILIQGRVEKERIKLRSSAKSNDIICLTGNIGESGIGLGILLDRWKSSNDDYFVNKHHCPTAHLKQGRWLSQFESVHAMIDVSDGIASDLNQICTKSNIQAIIELNSLPFSSLSEDFFKANQEYKYKTALMSGEDYCLLLTIDAKYFSDISKKYKAKFNETLFQIGKVKEGNGLSFKENGKPIENTFSGFDHFIESKGQFKF